MTPVPPAATEAAQRLWRRVAAGASTDPEETAIAADQVYFQLNAVLGRWIGVEGFRALLDRSIGLAREAHPAIGNLYYLGGEDPVIAAAVREHGAAAVIEALIGVVAILVDLLARIIGTAMALHLIGQVGAPSPRGVISRESHGGAND